MGATVYDRGVARFTIAGDIVYDGKTPVYEIKGDWFRRVDTQEWAMWVDADYGNGTRIPPWHEEEVAANAATVVKAEQFKAMLGADDDTLGAV
jgi:hypothetical protein